MRVLTKDSELKMHNKQNTKNTKDKPNIDDPGPASQSAAQESSMRTGRISSMSVPKEMVHVLGMPAITHNLPAVAKPASTTSRTQHGDQAALGSNRSRSMTPKDRSISEPAPVIIPPLRDSPVALGNIASLAHGNILSKLDHPLTLTRGFTSMTRTSPILTRGLKQMESGLELISHAGFAGRQYYPKARDILKELDNSREE